MKKRLLPIICLIAAIALLDEAGALFLMDREQPAAHKVVESERSRIASPDASDSEIKALVDGNSAFAFNLYQALRETGEELLSAQKIGPIVDRLERHYIALTMPRFEFESDFSLKETLTTMGMPAAFSPENADFSAMTGDRGLFIEDVIHKAFISVDEAGTEAAAATAVVAREALPPVAVNVDRPFLFFIRDIETGTVLFVGRVLNPAA